MPDHSDNDDVIQQLRQRRHDTDVSLRILSERTGISRHYISRIENQRVTPKLDTVQRLARALGVRLTIDTEDDT